MCVCHMAGKLKAPQGTAGPLPGTIALVTGSPARPLPAKQEGTMGIVARTDTP